MKDRQFLNTEPGSRNQKIESSSERFYSALLEDAIRYIDNLGGSASMVSGTLGVDSSEFKKNLVALETQIAKLESAREPVFNQTAYIDKFIINSPRDYASKFETFYKGLIQSGKIKKVYVMPGSTVSLGVRSEINYAREAGVPVVFLDEKESYE
jgi:hypothetical protein